MIQAHPYNSPMQHTLLRTKLFLPTPPPDQVPRHHLLARLDQGLARQSQMTLIAAPAGAGKSTLLSAWLAAGSRPAAWVALDSRDSDPRRFLAYLVAALQTLPGSAAGQFGANTLARLQAPQPLPLETILITLINEIATLPEPFLLVLDDYHAVDAAPVDELLTFLLDNQPPQLHLVLGSREDPNLPLARLRARGKLMELRAADLRFSPAETAVFLNDLMHLDLSPAEINALESRTEGWAAGLQMAALALQTTPAARQDRRTFIDAFTGSHRFVLDYLLEEVLQRQPPPLRQFLLSTSILDRLTGSLCDAVMGDTGSGNGRQQLQTLERLNLFLVPLDDQRQWYRYHHLFGDVLQAHLRTASGIDRAQLHRRASAWFAAHDTPEAAIRHSLAAADFPTAARLISAAWPAMDRSFQSATWLMWAEQLPDELVRSQPHLTVQYAWALIDNGKLEAATARLQAAEERLAQHPDSNAPADESLPAMLMLARAQIALSQGQVDLAADFARQGHALADTDALRRAQAEVIQGVADWSRGNLEAAYRAMSGWISSMIQADNLYFAVASTFVLADLREAQGRLHDAIRIYDLSLAELEEEKRPLRPFLSHHYLGLALLYHEMGKVAQAEAAWSQARDVGKQSVLLDWPYRWQRAQARRKMAVGEWAAALELLDEAERQYVPHPIPYTEPLGALRARIYLRQGRLPAARAWVQTAVISADDPLHYLQEFAHLTLVRVLLAEHAQDADDTALLTARALLDRLLPAAEAGGRLGRVIEIRLLQAIAMQAAGNKTDALHLFGQALRLAQPAGYFRIFADEGAALVPLLHGAITAQMMPDYAAAILAAMVDGEAIIPDQPLVDPLSSRELEVLRLFQTELTGPQIADELVVALSTIRSHTKQIYSKLGVSNRRAAVNRAAALGLLDP